jgi:uncharacterized protein
LSDFLVSSSDVRLHPAPIDRSWIHEGNPVTRSCVVSKSRDGSAFTFLWDCTAGVFTWRYDADETLYVLEGEAVLFGPDGERRIAAGDVVFFHAGTQVKWRVDSYIRKVAFVRRALPTVVALPLRVAWRLAALLRQAFGPRAASTPRPGQVAEQVRPAKA